MNAIAERVIPRIAVATICETRDRFFVIRSSMVEEEMEAINWLSDEYEVLASNSIRSEDTLKTFIEEIRKFDPHMLVIHIPVWTDPIFSVILARSVSCPVLLLGNMRKDTSSMVGMLGGGGSLDQVGIRHWRIMDHKSDDGRKELRERIKASFAYRELRGQKLGVFGGRSLGMITATADPSQWMKLFGVDIEHIDQMVIRDQAERIPQHQVDDFVEWLESRVMKVTYGGLFNKDALEKQARSYLATKFLVEERGLDFVGVKCQPEMADGYTTQCVAHMLSNGTHDETGHKAPIVHACEADLDGALTMQILKLISGGLPTALLDMRWRDIERGIWTMANCGAFASDFGADESDPTGLSSVEIAPHVIGEAGGCALPMMAKNGEVTLARLCRTDGKYWMAIIEGEILPKAHDDLKDATAVFPQAYIKANTDSDFFQRFGSNHSHMVRGHRGNALASFCEVAGIESRIWR